MTELNEVERGASDLETGSTSLTIWHCIGLTILIIILQMWVELFVSGAPNTELRDINWVKISIISGVAGFLTALAGAILAGPLRPPRRRQ